eukprot:scaffold9972_cov118-Isochrysis_galbana.AAC.19
MIARSRAAITSILTDLLLRMLPVVWTSSRDSLKINSMLCAVNLRPFLRTNDVARTTNLIRLSHGLLSTSSTGGQVGEWEAYEAWHYLDI